MENMTLWELQKTLIKKTIDNWDTTRQLLFPLLFLFIIPYTYIFFCFFNNIVPLFCRILCEHEIKMQVKKERQSHLCFSMQEHCKKHAASASGGAGNTRFIREQQEQETLTGGAGNTRFIRDWGAGNTRFIRDWRAGNTLFIRDWRAGNTLFIRDWGAGNTLFIRDWRAGNTVHKRLKSRKHSVHKRLKSRKHSVRTDRRADVPAVWAWRWGCRSSAWCPRGGTASCAGSWARQGGAWSAPCPRRTGSRTAALSGRSCPADTPGSGGEKGNRHCQAFSLQGILSFITVSWIISRFWRSHMVSTVGGCARRSRVHKRHGRRACATTACLFVLCWIRHQLCSIINQFII